MVLTLLIAIPLAAAPAAWLAARYSSSAARWIALAACAADFGLALWIWAAIPGVAGMPILYYRAPWIPRFGVSFHLSMDGLSLLLVLLTALLGVIAVACSWREVIQRIGTFHLALLVLLSGIVGVFLAYDLFLFYFFWELMLVPMYFLIGIWGHENRLYAAIKFFLFTLISGLFMLAAIIGLHVLHARSTGVQTFDYPALLSTARSTPYAFWLMLGLFVGFAVKLPAVPLHTWLPDAHTEAPTAGSVILAGLLLKTGAYGLMRFAVPLFPEESIMIAPAAMILGAVGIIYGAVLAFAQTDFKRMVAYTSVSHLGFVLLGIYSGHPLALQGAVMQIIAHGVSTGALFLVAGMIQERTHTRDLGKLGGLWETAPKMGGFTLLFALAALGLPGLGNFVGEFLVLLGVFQVSPVLAVISAAGLVASVVYGLRLVGLSMLGPNEHHWQLPDLSAREMLILCPLALAIFWLGLYPRPVFEAARPSVIPIEAALSSEAGRNTGDAR